MADYDIPGDDLCACPIADEITNQFGLQVAVENPADSYQAKASRYQAFCFNERTNSLAGPFASPDIVAAATKDNSAEMYTVSRDKKILKTDLLDLNHPEFPPFSDPFGDIETEPELGDFDGVVGSKTGSSFLYRNLHLSEPFSTPVTESAIITDGLYFANSYMGIMETNWMHLGDEHSEKQVYRIDLAFHKNSCGHLWLYVQNESGATKGQYKGMLKEHMKVFTNLRGRRFRVKMFVATHNNYPWAMRDMAVGYNIGKSF